MDATEQDRKVIKSLTIDLETAVSDRIRALPSHLQAVLNMGQRRVLKYGNSKVQLSANQQVGSAQADGNLLTASIGQISGDLFLIEVGKSPRPISRKVKKAEIIYIVDKSEQTFIKEMVEAIAYRHLRYKSSVKQPRVLLGEYLDYSKIQDLVQQPEELEKVENEATQTLTVIRESSEELDTLTKSLQVEAMRELRISPFSISLYEKYRNPSTPEEQSETAELLLSDLSSSGAIKLFRTQALHAALAKRLLIDVFGRLNAVHEAKLLKNERWRALSRQIVELREYYSRLAKNIIQQHEHYELQARKEDVAQEIYEQVFMEVETDIRDLLRGYSWNHITFTQQLSGTVLRIDVLDSDFRIQWFNEHYGRI